jgi:hypothetical protein
MKTLLGILYLLFKPILSTADKLLPADSDICRPLRPLGCDSTDAWRYRMRHRPLPVLFEQCYTGPLETYIRRQQEKVCYLNIDRSTIPATIRDDQIFSTFAAQ